MLRDPIVTDLLLTGPHRAWVDFFAERFDVAQGRGAAETDALWGCALEALRRPERLSTRPSAFGARFRLLLLARRCLHALGHGAHAARIQEHFPPNAPDTFERRRCMSHTQLRHGDLSLYA